MTVLKWGGETLVNTNVSEFQSDSTVALLGSGGYVVSWSDSNAAGGDGDDGSVKFQRFDAAGNKLGGETIANFTAAGLQESGAVVATADGGFAIVWRDITATNIEYRRFDADGAALDAADRVLALGGIQSAPVLAALGTGFVTAFQNGAATDDILVQRFLTNGDTTGAIISVAATSADERNPALAELAGGGHQS